MTNDAPAQASVATWLPLDENGSAELRVNGKRITSFPSYPAAEEAAQRINAALPPSTVGAEDGAVAFTSNAQLREMTRSGGTVVGMWRERSRPEDVALYTRPAPAADGVKDGRPEGWTEALAISFMAANGHNPEVGMFAKLFSEGAWREIKDEWPEFVEFASVRIRACLATDKEGA